MRGRGGRRGFKDGLEADSFAARVDALGGIFVELTSPCLAPAFAKATGALKTKTLTRRSAQSRSTADDEHRQERHEQKHFGYSTYHFAFSVFLRSMFHLQLLA